VGAMAPDQYGWQASGLILVEDLIFAVMTTFIAIRYKMETPDLQIFVISLSLILTGFVCLVVSIPTR
jgi:hypothetical protein